MYTHRKLLLQQQNERFNKKYKTYGKSVERVADNEVAQKLIEVSFVNDII